MGTDIDSSFSNYYGSAGLVYILVVLICITFSWWGLQQLRLEVFLKNPRSAPAKVLLIFLSVVLGYQVAGFLFSYFTWAGMLKELF